MRRASLSMAVRAQCCADRPDRWWNGTNCESVCEVQSALVTVPGVADALRHVTVTGVFYCPSFLRRPWGGTLPPTPGCLWFHAVTSGHCELEVDGARSELQPGDLALVPHGTGHRIMAGTPTEFPNIPDLPHEQHRGNYAVLRHGSDGPLTELVCGGLRLEHPSARRLVEALPPVVVVRAARRSALGATLDLLAEEVQRDAIGSEAVISRLCDIIVIQAIREWTASDEANGSPWLRAMSDPQLGPALAALHADPAAPWTVASLASQAAMSRSAFAAHFRDTVGQPVMGYLTDLRMQMAVDLLHRGERTIAEVASAVGYESDASFSRAFKRNLGSSPRQAARAG
jgi:AraC-like DNA-binding protein